MKKIDSVEKYFVGLTPPFLLFEKEYHSLDYVVENHNNDRYYKDHNPACQVAFIGILSYFEAFCKHQFAAAINIFPELAFSFSEKRKNLKIDLSTIISLRENTFENLGFILAEKYDFGSASSINSNFRDLLLITPFSKKRTKIFEEIIYKRNLFVHHAGFYTLQSLNTLKIDVSEQEAKAFVDNVSINMSIYQEYADFLFKTALAITRETIKALKSLEEFKPLDQNSSKFKAIEELGVGVYDRID